MKAFRDKDGDLWVEASPGTVVCIDEQDVILVVNNQEISPSPIERTEHLFGPLKEV